MRGRTAAAFGFGFAAGVLCLAVALWASGSLKVPGVGGPLAVNVPHPAAEPGVPATPEPPPAPDVQSLIEQGKQRKPALPSPAEPEIPASGAAPPPAAPAHEGEADRIAPSAAGAPRIASPIDGIDLKKLTDTFNEARDGRKHEALDIPAPRGTPVHAVAEGNVVKLFTSKQGGLTVYQFDNTGKFCYYYAHLDKYAPGLKEGTLLRRGDVLGYVGTTGNAPKNTPHLHFAVFRLGPEKHWWKGTAIDPLPLMK